MITLPYAALRTRVCRHTGSTLGFVVDGFEGVSVPYAALPQRRAVPYSRIVGEDAVRGGATATGAPSRV